MCNRVAFAFFPAKPVIRDGRCLTHPTPNAKAEARDEGKMERRGTKNIVFFIILIALPQD
jgi:hypothetical protein